MLHSSDYNTKELKADDLEDKLMEADKDELKEEAESRDLKVSGSKSELAERIIEDEKEADRKRNFTFTAEGETVQAENYQDALDKFNN